MSESKPARICQSCQEEFVPENKTGRPPLFCSRCRAARNAPASRDSRPCEWCGIEFVPARQDGRVPRYHSIECRTKANNHRPGHKVGGERSWPRSADITAEVIAAYQSGTSTVILGEKYGVGPEMIARLLRREGVTLRHRNASTPAKLRKGGRVTGSGGYTWLLLYPNDPLYPAMARTQFGQGAGRYALEHRVVMARHLGRPLYAWENVHHKNGIRDDNSLENLELWVTPQPTGQRPVDLVAFVAEYYPQELEALGWYHSVSKSPWVPASSDGLPPGSYPQWRRQEAERRA